MSVIGTLREWRDLYLPAGIPGRFVLDPQEADEIVREIDRLTSRDSCPEWNCSDLSTEDRREGKQCAQHPCTCVRPPRGPITEEMVEAAARSNYEFQHPAGIGTAGSWEGLGEDWKNAYREEARCSLEAAEAKR